MSNRCKREAWCRLSFGHVGRCDGREWPDPPGATAVSNGNEPAHPTLSVEWGTPARGVTKREHFAALALQGILSVTGGPSDRISGEERAEYFRLYARDSVAAADALLLALEEVKP